MELPVSWRARLGFDHRWWCWTALMLGGFAYVALVVHGRESPFVSRAGNHGEAIRLLLSLPLLYVLAPRRVIRPFWPDWRAAARWNGLAYAAPFFAALHWDYLSMLPYVNHSLTFSDFERMHPVGRAVFGAGGVLILALAAYHGVLARREGILAPYLGAMCAVIGGIALVTWFLHDSHYLHVHHYFLFGIFIPFTRFPTPLSTVCQALCAGVYVEGVASWSMSTIWHPR